jgi:hypothetical protein
VFRRLRFRVCEGKSDYRFLTPWFRATFESSFLPSAAFFEGVKTQQSQSPEISA